jgi:leucyl-tRNA synthetase
MSRPNTPWSPYDPRSIESKWQRRWEVRQLYAARETKDKAEFYCLDFFPYPSGDGLHVGHCRNYIPTDVTSRFKRMQGFNVLHPMGWDSFGEPTEQFAETHGIHPREATDRATANFRRQMTMIGCSYDWSREIDSSKPEFYRWTQWFFLLLYRRGLAYRDTSWQWWCPVCQTTLSSHEVAGGVCWRGHTGVTKREIPSWYFRITAYADELISGLEGVDWPESIKTMQTNWIGRSEGCEIDFLTEQGEAIPVFTTRADTVYGATFFVLAPEHPMVERLTTPEQRVEVENYAAGAVAKSEIERLAETGGKSGVFTGGYVTNPLSEERIPVWVADYVLPTYGTGAVMGVPAHDQRDLEFARNYDLRVKEVIVPAGSSSDGQELGEAERLRLAEAYTCPGMMVNSGPFDGLTNKEGMRRVGAFIEERGVGRRSVQYKMRDWLIGRQRYWGTPIPIVHCNRCGEVPVPESQLPVLLPTMVDFAPDGSGRSPLARVPEFVNTTCPTCDEPAQRETDTMGGFACSSWYYLRFTSPHYDQGPFDPEAMRYWMPVDLYVGGAEHAVLHLLYARFWTKVMADAGLVPFREPFARLMNQGQLLAPDGRRMSKSRGNVITPDEVVDQYGADALRVYEMFMAPFDQDVSWNTEGINGAWRFLNRIWSLYGETYIESSEGQVKDKGLERLVHKTIRRVSERMEGFRFNTMLSVLMTFVNELVERQRNGHWRTSTYHQALDTLMLLLAPCVPHIADELWQLTGHAGSVHEQEWPIWDTELARDEVREIPIQVDGKVRQVIEFPIDASEEEVEEKVLAHVEVRDRIGNREIDKIYYVPGKIFSIVTRAKD